MTTALQTQKRRSGGGKTGVPRISTPMVLLALLTFAILVLPVMHRPTNLNKPEGYTDLVNALLRVGYLRAEDGGDGSGERFMLAENKGVEAFAEASFLGSDMLRVSGLVWGEGEIQPTAHYETGPRDDFSGWKGELRFRTLEDAVDGASTNAPRTELIDEKGHVHVALGRASDERLQVPSCTLELQGGSSCPAPSDSTFGTSSAGVTRVQKIIFQKRDENFELLMVGNQPVLHLPPGSAAYLRKTIRINGASIPALGGGGQLYLPLRPSGRRPEELLNVSLDVRLADGSRRFRIVERLPLISRYRGDGSRAYPGAGLETFAKPIERVMDERGDAWVQTALIEELQAASQNQLTKGAKTLLKYGPSFRASATLMDGISGEVVALATFPTRSAGCNEEEMEACDTLAERDQDDPGSLHLFATNTNFINLPIGSAAKPPFAVAITDRFPELISLRIRDSADFGCAMGWGFGSGTIEGHNYSGILDYPTFLAVSSNRYAIDLMLLGLKDSGGANDSYLARSPQQIAASRELCPDEQKAELGGMLMKWRPPFGYMGPNDTQAPWDSQRGGNLSVAGAWRERFRDWFCIDIQRTNVDSTKSLLDPKRCPPTLWPEGSELAGQKISGVTLTPPNLDMDEVQNQNRMGDYLFNVLGGGRSRWSTILLAQAYARIVTGDDVQASLAPRKTPRVNDSLGINPEVRRQTLLGMNLIFSVDGGTAKGVLPKLAQNVSAPDGSIVRFYAKTGTPNVVRYTPETDGSRALNAFRTCLRGESIGPGQGARIFVGTLGESKEEAARAIAAHPRCGSRFAAQANLLAREIARINADEDARRRVQLLNDVVTRLPTQRENDRVAGRDPSPKGKVFALVAARYPEGTRFDGQAMPQPCSVSVLTVNFQSHLGEPALNFTKAMLGQPELLAWLGRRGSAGCGRVNLAAFAS